VGLALRAIGRRGDEQGVTEGVVDVVGVVTGLAVEESERGRAGGVDGVLEGPDDGLTVLDAGDVCADNGARVGVDVDLEVGDMKRALDVGGEGQTNRNLRTVADPLSVREERLERAPQGPLVGTSARPPFGESNAMSLENVPMRVAPKGMRQWSCRWLQKVVKSPDQLAHSWRMVSICGPRGPGGAGRSFAGPSTAAVPPRSQSFRVPSGTRIASACASRGTSR
jgi:hypothetical protein